MNLTKNFTLEELIHSDAAVKNGLSNLPTDEVVYNLTALCQDVLQPLRDALGVPIKINSGYRSPEVNALVGGKPTSQHRKGEAADIECEELGNKALFDKIIELGVYDQAIIEHDFAWIHVSHKADSPDRKQILKIQ